VSRPAHLGVEVKRKSLHDARAADDLAGEAELLGRRSPTAAEI
jgi:hypothetical protein